MIDVRAPFSGVAMKYHEDLQPIEDAEGTAVFTGHDITIDVVGARTYNTRASEGKVVIGNFTETVTAIDIHARAKGPADDLRQVIDRLTGNKAYPVKIAAGKADTRLSFQWPLSHFSEETFDYHAASKIEGMEVPDFRGFRWAQKALLVSLDRKSIAVSGTGGEISSETYLDSAIPIKKIEARGELSYAPAGIDVSSFSADLGGPALKFTGRSMAADPFPRVLFNGTIDGLPIKTAHRYWPRNLTPPLREWIRTRVSDGRISHAGIRIDLDPAVSSLRNLPKTAVDIDAAFSGVQMAYQPPLPPIKGGDGGFTLSTDAARIWFDSGEVAQSRIIALQGDITGILTETPSMDVLGEIQGPASDLIASMTELLKGTPEAPMPIPLKEAEAATRIQLRSPLSENLSAADLDYTITSDITRIAIDDYHGFNLKNGEATATLNNGNFLLNGSIWSGQTPVSIHWENSADTKETLRLSAAVNPDNHADLHLPPLPFLNGTVQADMDITPADDGTAITSRIEFTKAAVDLERWGWVKPAGTPAVLQGRASIADGKTLTVSNMTFSGENLDIQGSGSVTLGDPATFDFQFDPLNVGNHRLSAGMAFDAEKGFRMDLKGARFDAAGILKTKQPSPEPVDPEIASATDPPSEKEKRPRAVIKIDLEQALLANDITLSQPKGRIVWEDAKIRSALVDGFFDKNAPLHVAVTRKNNPEKILIETEDAGSLLKGMDLSRYIQGGKLVFNGQCDDFLPTTRPVSGKIEIRDFLVVGAPGLVKVLSMASFVGALGQLQSGGISFSTLDGDVGFENNVMTLKNGRMEGISLAMTAEGTYDIQNRMSNISGVVIPVNILNQLLDVIPVFGKMIVGEGIIATDYTIKGPYSDPEVSISPLTTLSVGFLRNVFKGFNSRPTEGGVGEKEPTAPVKPGKPLK